MLQDIIDYINSRSEDMIAAVVLVLVVFGICIVATRCVTHLRKNGKLTGSLALVIQRGMRWGSLLIATLMVLQAMGFLENAWTTLTAVLGLVAIGFVAVWSVLSNALCSIILLINRPFEVGDTIELPADNIAGKVVNFNMIFTRLQDDQGDYVQVPNNLFFQKPMKRKHGDSTVTLDEQLEKEEDTV